MTKRQGQNTFGFGRGPVGPTYVDEVQSSMKLLTRIITGQLDAVFLLTTTDIALVILFGLIKATSLL